VKFGGVLGELRRTVILSEAKNLASDMQKVLSDFI
jgi:hypothetical protein